MPWQDMLTSFKQVLYQRIAECGMTGREFAKKAGISSAFLSDISNKKSPPPMDRMEGWADILGLTGESREYFLDLAALEVVPDRAKRLFEPWRPGFKAIQMAIDRQCAAEGRTYPYPELLEPDAAPTDAEAPPPRSRAAEVSAPPSPAGRRVKPRNDRRKP